MSDVSRNEQVVSAFRANRGVVDPSRPERPLLLLTTTGRRSGRSYTTPLMYRADGERLVIFATKGGADTDPDWFTNLMASGRATVELADGAFPVEATALAGEERDRLYAAHAAEFPQYQEYEKKTARVIPVVVLERAG